MLLCTLFGSSSSGPSWFFFELCLPFLSFPPPYFTILLSIRPITGFITKKYIKYNTDATCPIVTYGSSTTCPPMYVNIIKSPTNTQYINLLIGLNCLLRILLCSTYGNTNNTTNDANNAITPINLFGIDRNIAYANKKYHSGWICAGVTNGFAGI